MADFVYDNVALPASKVPDIRPVPVGQESSYWGKTDANAVFDALTSLRKTVPFIHPKNFGALCDGVTNDSVAIQAAVTAAGTTGTVVIPGNCVGTYTNPNLIPIFDLRTGSGGTGVNLPFVATNATTVRGIDQKFAEIISVQDYGADPTGVLDSTTAFINALAQLPSGGTLYMPPGTYLISSVGTEIIKISQPIKLIGAGMLATVLKVKSTVGASTDVIRVNSTVGQLEGIVLSDFMISPQSGTPGRHGINIDTTTQAIDKMVIERVYIQPLGGRAIVSTNPTPITNGFFTSIIRDNVLKNGILLQNSGDNLVIMNNKISGPNAAIDMTSVPGAVGNVIFGNNTTSTGCALHIGGGSSGVKVLYNQFQGNVGDAGSNGAGVDLDGTAANPIVNVELAGNYISPTESTLNSVRVNWADQANIHDNTIVRSGGGTKQIVTTANATNTRIGCNRYEPNTDTLLVNGLTDGGANTTWETSDRGSGMTTFRSLRIGINGGTVSALIHSDSIRAGSGFPIGFTSGADPSASGLDSGLSRIGAAQIALGNGTAADASGLLSLATIVSSKAGTHGRVVLTYSATIATDASLGNSFSITATNGTAFTISNPTGLRTGQRLLYTIRNASGGVLGAITWGATFKINATAIAPANGQSRSIEFVYDGTNLVELWRGAADVPN